MGSLHSLGTVMFQDQIATTDGHWIMIGVVVLASISLIQFLAIVFGAIKALAVVAELKAKVNDLHGKATPILAKTNEIIADLKPKMQTISENAVQLSYTVREKTQEIGETVSKINKTVLEVNETVADANRKTRSQVGHVNSMVDTALSSTEKLTHTVVDGINAPIKRAAGLIAGWKTGFDRLVKNYQGKGPVKPFSTTGVATRTASPAGEPSNTGKEQFDYISGKYR